jgi:hypothetical protein
MPKPGDRLHARGKAACEKWMSGNFTGGVKGRFRDFVNVHHRGEEVGLTSERTSVHFLIAGRRIA